MKKLLITALVLVGFFSLNSSCLAQSPYSVELQVGAGGQVGISATPTPTSAPSSQSPTPIVTSVPGASSNTSVTPTPAIYNPPGPVPGPSVGASVGEYYLNLSGYSSPFSSIVLISDNISLRSVVSDEKGNFSISQVLIKSGFSNFCLKAKDFRNLSSSETCINLAPASASVVINNIFLPPSFALWKSRVAYYEQDLGFGYTMPGASVVLHVGSSGGSANNQMTTKADANGYYRFILKFPSGKYDLYATARYNNNDSKAPSKTVILEVMGLFGLLLNLLKDIWGKFIILLTSLAFGPLWIALILIIIIIALCIKLWGNKFTSIMSGSGLLGLLFLFTRKKKKLHHWWFVGY